MKGWLVYDAAGAQKNQWYIAKLQREAKKFGGELELKIQENLRVLNEKLPDFAIVRTICPHLNKELETRGLRVFNNAKTAEIACDKYKTYEHCKAWGIPVLPTWRVGEKEEYPCVMKTVDGHGGAEVFWVENGAQAKAIEKSGGRYICQQPNGILGRDMRVYAIGGKIVGAVLRSAENDFRSNFSLGGSVTAAKVDEPQKAIVKKLYETLQFDYVGIDFLPTTEGWVLNEIEDSAGARMLYQTTDTDIAELFIRHVFACL